MSTISISPYTVSRVDGRVDIYVDAAVGSDTNTGDATSPLATIVEAERRIPFVVTHPVLIHVKAHPGAGYDPPFFHARCCHENIYVIGEDYVELLTGTMSSSNNLNQTVNEATGADDVLRGKTLEILDGAMATERRTLRTNTGNSLIPLVGFSAAVPAGSAYRVTESAVVIRCATDTWMLSEGCGYPVSGAQNLGLRHSAKGLVLVNLKVDAQAASLQISFTGSLCLHGIEIVGAATNVWIAGTPSGSSLQVGSDTGIQLDGIASRAGQELGAASATSWAAWGLVQVANNLHFTGISAYLLGLNAHRTVWWGCPRAQVFAFRITDGIRVLGNGESGACSVYFSRHVLYLGDAGASDVEAAASPVIQATYTGACLRIDASIRSTSDGVGVLAQRGADIQLTGGQTVDVGTGTAVKATSGGTVHIITAPTIVAGTAYECGTLVPVTEIASNMITAGSYLVHADGSAIRRT